MINNYIKHSVMLLGAAILAGTSAMADNGTWRNINYKVSNPAWVAGWSGAITDVSEGVGEVFNGAFDAYQVLPDMPAGDYTLTCNAFYRYTNAPDSYPAMKNGANNYAYIYINDTKAPICSLFDKEGVSDATILDADGNYIWGVVPNWLGEANTDFLAGHYLNTITVHHDGGDLTIGIGNTGGEWDEWTAFDNFRLTGPEGDCTDKIVNADFSEGMGQGNWDLANINGENKKPDLNKGGGVLRKVNASPYNIGQTLENMPAGLYRFSVQSFLRHGSGNTAGGYRSIKANEWIEGESAYDRHVNATEEPTDNAYIYINEGGKDVGFIDSDGTNPWYDGSALVLNDNWAQTPIKCLFDENLATYPDNIDEAHWCDSGFERESAACFVNNPDLYRNYVELTLTTTSTLTFGIRKDKNHPAQYWNPWRDMKLEYFDTTVISGIDEVAGNDASANAPIEYYNIQGMRIAEPANGLYIVKQGNKVEKRIR